MTSPSFTLRPGGPDDVPRILGLIRELAEYERLTHEVRTTEEDLRSALFGEAPVAEVLLAEAEEETVGFALFFSSFSTFLGRPGIYLEDLYVRPAYRSRGLGRALLARLAALAVERGGGRVEWAVLDWNESAIGFYRKLGAVPMDGWTTFRLAGEALERLAGEDSRSAP